MAKCSVCGREDYTVDVNMFDGMCVSCIGVSLNNEEVYKLAKKNNKNRINKIIDWSELL